MPCKYVKILQCLFFRVATVHNDKEISLNNDEEQSEIIHEDNINETIEQQPDQITVTNIYQKTNQKFFDSMCQMTLNLPEHLQMRIQRKIFQIVMEAREDNLFQSKAFNNMT